MEQTNEISAKDRARAEQVVERAISLNWPGALAAGLRPMAGDASSRRYLRCLLKAEPAAPSPPSVVVMLLEGSTTSLSSDELGVFGATGPAELPFLNVWRFLSARSSAVPAVYAVDEEARALLLEDVGDLSLWDAASSKPCNTESLFRRALGELAFLQEKAVDDGSGCYAFAQSFDARLFSWELEHFLEYGIRGAGRGELRACRAELAVIAERLAGLPRVFCHRDYHAWNIHLQAGRVRILDFQDALLGPAFYDVASLLTDRITPQRVDPAMERRLLLGFAAAVGPACAPTSGLIESYHLCVLQRALKVIGRFHYLAEEKGKTAYLSQLPAVAATARSSASRLPGLSATAELLAKHLRPVSGSS